MNIFADQYVCVRASLHLTHVPFGQKIVIGFAQSPCPTRVSLSSGLVFFLPEHTFPFLSLPVLQPSYQLNCSCVFIFTLFQYVDDLVSTAQTCLRPSPLGWKDSHRRRCFRGLFRDAGDSFTRLLHLERKKPHPQRAS